MDRRLLRAGFLATGVLGAAIVAFSATEEPPAAPAAAPAEAPTATKFSADQIDQMVAPVALYPDALLMQICIASTYPLEVVEADRWRRQNASLKGDALDKALEQKDWDPSVEGLTHFPDLLKRMSDNLDWTKDLGDAFLDQKDDVLAAVQRMRRAAQQAGNLSTNKEQTVTKEVVNNKETIVIQPADPQVVYVPTYPPTAYGPSYAPPAQYYPPATYGYTSDQMLTTSLLSFGAGVAVGALISDGCDWGSGDVHVNNNYYGGGGGGGGGNNNNNVNIDKSRTKINTGRDDRQNQRGDRGQGGRQNWQHNPEHRRNVGYRDPKVAQRYESQNRSEARNRQAREQARGYDTGRGNRGQAAQQPARGGGRGTPGQMPAGGGGGRGTPGQPSAGRGDGRGTPSQPSAGRGGGRGTPSQATSGRGGGQARPADTGRGQQGAFNGYGNGGATRQASARGANSRGGQSWAGGGSGGGGGSRGGFGGGGGRGGGGGGRGGGGGGRGGGGGGGRGGGRR